MARINLAILTLSMTLSGCFNIPLTSKGKLDSSGQSGGVTQAASKSVGEDKEIATFDPDSKTDVHLTTPKITGLAGASVTIAPGSLGIAVDLVVEQASDFGETSISGEMGLADDIQVSAASPGMIIRPTENVDLKKPLSLSMPLPVGIGFRLQGGSKFGIFYKYFDPTQQKLVTGLKIVDGVNVKLSFDEASGKDVLGFEGYFGAYWAAILSREVTAAEIPPPKPAEEPIINKAKVAVIQNSGVVKETEVVQKQTVPAVVWPRPSISFSVTTRMVTVSVKPPEGQKVDACKIDLFESVLAQKGISLESPLGTQVDYLITNPKEHALVARFRCTDSQARITITPWSDVVIIPAVQVIAPVAVADEICSDEMNYLTISAQNEMGNYVPSRSIPKVGKCKYAIKLFSDQVTNFFLHTPFYDYACGLATHALGTTTQTLSCDKYLGGSLGSNFMTLPAYNVNLEIDFTTSRTAPKITVSKLPCAIQDFYMQVGSSSASVIPTAAEKMVHKGACEFESYSTTQPFMGSGYVTFRNLDGSFTCAQDGAYLNGGAYYENICGSGFRKFNQMGTTAATGHRLVVRFGESANEGGLNPWRQSSFQYKVESNCPDKLFISSAFHGTTPVEGKNVLYRYSSCTYGFSFFAEDPTAANYDFKIKSLDGTRSCGGVASQTSILMDCSAAAPAISFAGNATEKTYQFSLSGDPFTGQFTSASLYNQPTNCDGYYLHANAMNGFNNTAAEAMVETKQCYFEKLWTPTAANLGFNLTTSSNRILSIGFSNDAQPTVDGGIVRLNWYDEPSAVIKTLPVGAAANTTYKIILDARSGGESKLKVELYDSTFYVCPDDLHLVGSNLLSYMPSADNKFTYHGACNYSFTLRNDSNATATLSYTITNSSQSVQCANGTGASPPPNFYDPRSASITCAASVDPYSIDVPGKSTVRFFVHRTSAGDAVALTTRTLAPDYPVIALSGQAGDGLPLGGRNFHEPDYAYNYSYERPQSFIWTATAANTFQLAANWGNYFCSPINASAALISTAMPVRCRYAQTAPTSVFGPYNPGTLRIRFIPAVDVESNPHVTVEPYSQVNALVQVTSLFLGATTVVDPLASPNTDPTTTPGSMTLSQTWTAPNGELYLFGGQYANAVYNSLWRYAPGTGIWTLLNGTTAPGLPSSISGTLRPGARFGSVGWVDATNSRLYLFGGNGVGSSGTAGDLNDLWYYDIVGNTWNFVKGSTTATPTVTYPSVGSIGTPNSTYNPPARRYSTAFTDAGGNFWIYGGFDTNQIFYGDLWKFTPTSGTANLAGDWTWMGGTQGNSPTLSTDPVPVNRHSAAAWAVGNLVYVFGGLSYPAGSLNDLWTLNLTNGMWTLIQSHAPSEARFWENFAFHPDNKPVTLWGVKPMTWKQSADSFWLYNSGAFFNYRPSIKQWAIVSPGMIGNDISGFPIDPVFDPNVYDMGRKIDGAVWSGSSGFFLYGGYTNSTPYAWNDMWRIQFPTP